MSDSIHTAYITQTYLHSIFHTRHETVFNVNSNRSKTEIVNISKQSVYNRKQIQKSKYL